MSGNRNVVVVGAGMAGLGAAYTLRKHGLDVTVFEASPDIGGRVTGKQIDGFHVDVGANVFLESYGTIRQLASELGVSLKRTPVPINGGVYRSGRFHGFYGGGSPASRLKTAGTFLQFRLLSPKGLRQALRFVKMLKARANDLSFDDHRRILDLDTGASTTEFFESNFGTEVLERFIQPNLSSYTLGYPEEVGAAYAMVAAWDFGLNAGAWPCLPDGGPGVFVNALARACAERGGGIRVSTPVDRIVLEDGAVRGVVTEAGFVEADAVVCATTATKALEIIPRLPSGIRDVLRQVTYSKCCRVFFGVDSSPFPTDWYAVAFPRETGALMTGMSDSAVMAPETVPEGRALVDALVIGRRAEELFALSDEEASQQVLAEIRDYFPTMARPLFTHVHRWDEAVCLAPGGMMTALDRMRGQDLADVRGLFLAGEYMGVPSTNGALRSGIDTAEDCAAFFSQPAGR
ncbi:MAG: FAD-dependent oxidoreductase [Gemmatimonadales bacterium]|nr:FAD-dependent oxidoreductase [Gemmatimonadales bacterium]MYG18525.1 FAD-dependent oxidoreductase [Gemmatimonadales bacterium]MYH10530.1 FAD-dependent oxidoreductase [Gemmatimonadales bacterium]